MVRRFVRGLCSALALAATACSEPSSAPRGEAHDPPRGAAKAIAPAALDAAHEAYLDGDFVVMSERIRDVLLDPASSELVRKNAYALLDKAYAANRGKLPSRFSLPNGYREVQYGALRGMTKNGPFYKIFSRGRARDASHLVGLTVKRLPDEVLLDKKTNKGAFDLRDEEPGFVDFVIEAKVSALPGDGVFTIRLELDDGTVSEGWFIGHDLEATASPDVRAPIPSATLSDPNPRVSWLPFRTPEYSAFERRTLSVWVDQEGDESNNWDFWTDEPGDIDGVSIGAHAGTRAKKLVPGDYWLSVGFHELRDFGPIRVQRASSTVLPFRVVR